MDKNIENRIKKVLPLLNEKQKRIYLSIEAEAIGYEGYLVVFDFYQSTEKDQRPEYVDIDGKKIFEVAV